MDRRERTAITAADTIIRAQAIGDDARMKLILDAACDVAGLTGDADRGEVGRLVENELRRSSGMEARG